MNCLADENIRAVKTFIYNAVGIFDFISVLLYPGQKKFYFNGLVIVNLFSRSLYFLKFSLSSFAVHLQYMFFSLV